MSVTAASLFIDTEVVIGAGDALRRTFAQAQWSPPATPDVADAAATQAIGDLATALHGVAATVATQLDAAALTITTAAIETRTVDAVHTGDGDEDTSWVSWPA